jgi:hypothetical protein
VFDGPVYGLFLDCCEADLDGCYVCGDEIGDMGPGLAASGECVGEDGCEVFDNQKAICISPDDGSCSGAEGCDVFNNSETACRNGCDSDELDVCNTIGCDVNSDGYNDCADIEDAAADLNQNGIFDDGNCLNDVNGNNTPDCCEYDDFDGNGTFDCEDDEDDGILDNGDGVLDTDEADTNANGILDNGDCTDDLNSDGGMACLDDEDVNGNGEKDFEDIDTNGNGAFDDGNCDNDDPCH